HLIQHGVDLLHLVHLHLGILVVVQQPHHLVLGDVALAQRQRANLVEPLAVLRLLFELELLLGYRRHGALISFRARTTLRRRRAAHATAGPRRATNRSTSKHERTPATR